MIALSSCRQRPLQGASAQSVVQRCVKEESRRSTCSSSSNSPETDFGTSTPPPANQKATSVQGPAPALALTPTNDLFTQFMQAYIENRRQPTPAAALVEPREDTLDRPLKARNPDHYYVNWHMQCYYFY